MPFLSGITCDSGEDVELVFPYSIPAVADLVESGLKLNKGVTFFIGENGSGKSTILEGVADRWGFDSAGGARSRNLVNRDFWSDLGSSIFLNQPTPRGRPMDGFFLRAENFFNFASMLDDFEEDWTTADGYFSYGGKSLHQQSHGEAFFSLFLNRFGGDGVYLLDEPEAALSPQRQLAFLVRMKDLVEDHSQFIIATHSPILLGYPGATIYRFSEDGIDEVSWEESEPYQVTQRFLNDRDRMLGYLFSEDS